MKNQLLIIFKFKQTTNTIAKKSNKILVNHQLRYHPYIKKYKRIINNKKIKKIKLNIIQIIFMKKKYLVD